MIRAVKSYFHRGGMEPLLGKTIPEHFSDIVSCYPEREAVVAVAQNRRLSYGELDKEITKLAKGLLGAGFKKGERVGVWATDNLEWLLLQIATARIGVVLVNINPAYRQRELAYALQCSEVQGLFVIPSFRDSDYLSMLTSLVPELLTGKPLSVLNNQALPFLRTVVVYDPAAPETTARPAPGFTLWSEIIKAGEAVSEPVLEAMTSSLDCDEPINIQYTSGTTGFPKAVVLTHHNILNNAYFSAKAMHFTEQDRLCVPVPFYHCFGMVLANLLCLSVGACIVIPAEHFDPQAVLKAIDNEKCTAIHGVPTMFIAELESQDFADYDMSSLRTGIMAGAPCPPPLMRRVMEEMHCREILIGYGETEASPLTHLTSRDDSLERRTETVGKNLPHQEVKVVELNGGATVPLGVVGEICFRGYHLMHEYYGNEPGTRAAIDEHGWLHSGDLGSMDAEGYVKITGRMKEMIIRGGENIYPLEIESFLFAHPKIQQVAVFGVPDEYYGEQVVAWIQLQSGEALTDRELRAYCEGQLAHFKIPAYIRFVDRFPMTVTGKLQKFRMRELEVEKLNQLKGERE
ncbi:AMP-binding protein [Photobacterium proteolyticum]|uniref:AMP-binding protein n=1 Tax=Photobacterium proteolyticum TaxID=1903952 RepID=A0A1Q9GD38_9GAMM|nr:AMP-binding protein [Photobacterium proteolyticum]OLQ72317.1 AMP-binding protein [Photobacterium proteolyticum]